jgi:hypothetical protein
VLVNLEAAVEEQIQAINQLAVEAATTTKEVDRST